MPSMATTKFKTKTVNRELVSIISCRKWKYISDIIYRKSRDSAHCLQSVSQFSSLFYTSITTVTKSGNKSSFFLLRTASFCSILVFCFKKFNLGIVLVGKCSKRLNTFQVLKCMNLPNFLSSDFAISRFYISIA